MLLDAGADPNDTGDDDHIGVIGWATFFAQPGDVRRDVVSLLVERGARHHIFSAIALGDLDVIRTLVEQHPETLDARLSPRHHGQTALHFAIARGRADILDLLIDLDADLDATDHNRQTAIEFARLRGDRQAVERLLNAGARQPVRGSVPEPVASGLANSIQSSTPVIGSRDVGATLAWYTSLGFTEVARYPTDGSGVFWGLVTLGKAEITFDVRETAGARGVSLLLVTDRVQDLYEFLKSRQLERADVEFVQTLHEPVHGGLEFSIRDPNGLTLRFLQEAK
jgi:catechol 2,3-dioxygenase-like lactoylglutathione lyase family enzyme